MVLQIFVIACGVIAVSYAVLVLYYFMVFIQLPNFRPQNILKGGDVFISVLIPARNEESNIKKCLASILAQTYPAAFFEVIVIDDHSEDDTAAAVNSMAALNVKLLRLKDFVAGMINSYKKKSIEIGISAAKGELIVTTDADCTMPPEWLATIATFYRKKKSACIAMPVLISPQGKKAFSAKNFLATFQCLDFMALQGITAAAVSKNQMTMCNGANMAYEKSAFAAVEGFNGIDDIASGDDMLLMYKIFTKFPGQVHYLKAPEVIVTTEPSRSIGEFFNQRIRWAGKANKYQDKRILPVLLLVYTLNCLALILFLTALFYNPILAFFSVQATLAQASLFILLLKIFAEVIFMIPVADFFNRRGLLLFFPLLQPFHIVYTVVAGFLGKFGKYKWKGRTVK